MQEEADCYAARHGDRSYVGEAYSGATTDWAIVDMPLGIKRVTMDEIGGASQGISWHRSGGSRKFRFISKKNKPSSSSSSEDESSSSGDNHSRVAAHRYIGVDHNRRDKLWTAVTKRLVSRKAIEQAGYGYEETRGFYCISAFLHHVRRLLSLRSFS